MYWPLREASIPAAGRSRSRPGPRPGPAPRRGPPTVVQARPVVAARAVPVQEDGVADLERREQAVDPGPRVRLGVRLSSHREVLCQPEGELALAAPVIDEQLGGQPRAVGEDGVRVDDAGRRARPPVGPPDLVAARADLPPRPAPPRPRPAQ